MLKAGRVEVRWKTRSGGSRRPPGDGLEIGSFDEATGLHCDDVYDL